MKQLLQLLVLLGIVLVVDSFCGKYLRIPLFTIVVSGWQPSRVLHLKYSRQQIPICHHNHHNHYYNHHHHHRPLASTDFSSIHASKSSTASNNDCTFNDKYDADIVEAVSLYSETEEDNNVIDSLRQSQQQKERIPLPSKILYEGLPKGFYVIKEYQYHGPNSSGNDRNDRTTLYDSTTKFESEASTRTTSILDSMTNDRKRKLLAPTDSRNNNDPDNDRNHLVDWSNVTLPIALTIMDPITYPSLSRARKVCRQGNILIIRQPSVTSVSSLQLGHNTTTIDSQAKRGHNIDGIHDEMKPPVLIGRVGDRVYIGDIIGYQVRMYVPGTTNNKGSGNSSTTNATHTSYLTSIYYKKPSFELPVIYQDDYYALVNKPAGVICYKQGSGSDGLLSVRAMLPFVINPPNSGVYSILRRPTSVHRLDKPTSGLLCVVKTKPAMIHLSKQFHDRVVQKTYTAIINGIPDIESVSSTTISSEQAMALYDIDTRTSIKLHDGGSNNTSGSTSTLQWNVIDVPIDNQQALTLWRVLRYVPSLRGNNGYITMIECKPKTGRYNQIRRHMAWTLHCPIIGDTIYDGGHANAIALRGSGLFLCANAITHEHPYYNTVDGRLEWNTMNYANGVDRGNSINNSNVLWYCDTTDKVMISASIEIPNKFHNLLHHEQERHNKFRNS